MLVVSFPILKIVDLGKSVWVLFFFFLNPLKTEQRTTQMTAIDIMVEPALTICLSSLFMSSKDLKIAW